MISVQNQRNQKNKKRKQHQLLSVQAAQTNHFSREMSVMITSNANSDCPDSKTLPISAYSNKEENELRQAWSKYYSSIYTVVMPRNLVSDIYNHISQYFCFKDSAQFFKVKKWDQQIISMPMPSFEELMTWQKSELWRCILDATQPVIYDIFVKDHLKTLFPQKINRVYIQIRKKKNDILYKVKGMVSRGRLTLKDLEIEAICIEEVLTEQLVPKIISELIKRGDLPQLGYSTCFKKYLKDNFDAISDVESLDIFIKLIQLMTKTIPFARQGMDGDASVHYRQNYFAPILRTDLTDRLLNLAEQVRPYYTPKGLLPLDAFIKSKACMHFLYLCYELERKLALLMLFKQASNVIYYDVRNQQYRLPELNLSYVEFLLMQKSQVLEKPVNKLVSLLRSFKKIDLLTGKDLLVFSSFTNNLFLELCQRQQSERQLLKRPTDEELIEYVCIVEFRKDLIAKTILSNSLIQNRKVETLLEIIKRVKYDIIAFFHAHPDLFNRLSSKQLKELDQSVKDEEFSIAISTHQAIMQPSENNLIDKNKTLPTTQVETKVQVCASSSTKPRWNKKWIALAFILLLLGSLSLLGLNAIFVPTIVAKIACIALGSIFLLTTFTFCIKTILQFDDTVAKPMPVHIQNPPEYLANFDHYQTMPTVPYQLRPEPEHCLPETNEIATVLPHC